MTAANAGDKVAFKDVEEVIAAAARANEERLEQVSVEEVQDIAAQLDIPADLVAPAIEEVRRRRETQLAQERAREARTKRLRLGAAIGGGVLAVIIAVWLLTARAALEDAKLAVDRQRAQVINVTERQRATVRQWATAPDSPDKQAELSGAENRVRIERARYDELVTSYRRRAGGLAGSLFGYPSSLPLSTEIEQW